ncbi:lysine-N-methylase [Buttiauxella noackiae ATCC 51607]|uniref:Lysine-N-methylase n=1 Tax=Buttiauxella noackiae ATCC 51607 TaxID=1354255 RepID=A0A1B7HM52_9ENTR|nr:hypothetical protein [Buttiauxella noackiae]OAT16721.1 lysine-N-methylase [Buttiauxella noackiae ATCC 51607]
MELIDNYQPEYVKRFKENNKKCQCQNCLKEGEGYPYVTLTWKNQQRESLSLSCQTAAKEILLNPQAFILHESKIASESSLLFNPSLEVINQLCINFATHPAISLEQKIYLIGVLLSKVHSDNNEVVSDISMLDDLFRNLLSLADNNQLQKQMNQLPEIIQIRLTALKEIGKIKLNINRPLEHKMAFILKLSELTILNDERLAERLQQIQFGWQQGEGFFNRHQEILTNLLVYIIYNNTFPDTNENYGTSFFQLSEHIFRLKMIISIYCQEIAGYDREQIVTLISAYFEWDDKVKNMKVNTKQDSERFLLSGFALL